MGIRELRDHLTAAVRRVRDGESIEVTPDGRAVASSTAVPTRRIDRLRLVGDATEPVPLDAPLRRFPVTTGIGATQALEDDRAAR